MNREILAVMDRLPGELASVISGMAEQYPDLSEVRIRSGRHLSVLSGGRNIASAYIVPKSRMSAIVSSLCENSVHTHMDTIRKGYISIPGGIRVGICGKALIEEEEVVQISDITSLNIRIPSAVYQVSGPVYQKIVSTGFSCSFLLYSPPGVGKTTVLRDLAKKLCLEGNRRVCLLDERQELLQDSLAEIDNLDVFSGYPKAMAMEMAVRTMTPQYILCDEIGSMEEVLALLPLQNAGVPIIATAHAAGIGGLLRKNGMSILHKAGVFDYYVGIRRNLQENRVTFNFCDRKELIGKGDWT
jgi:stage III sporulation protein AA